MKISFFGAVEEVTGSRYLVQHEKIKILVDCGLFQGSRKVSMRNQVGFPVEPNTINAIVLTHAHIDHTGYIPALVKKGFKGKIYCSKATYALCAIMLVDSGFLQEEHAKRDAERKNSDYVAKEPLYTKAEAEASLKFFQVVEYDTLFSIGQSLEIKLIASGHILGASFIIISDGKKRLTFSGDLGRPDQFIMKSPPALKQTDFLVLESTYGDRLHEEVDSIKILGELINKTVKKGGVVVIPAFAVGRTQTILYCLYQLKQNNIIPDLPIFLDSPMGISVTDLFCNFLDEHKLPANLCHDIFNIATRTRMVQESKKIDCLNQPAVIIAGSGMADGGRVLHHLQHFISDAKNTILLVGFQGKGTEGNALVAGAKEIQIDGKSYVVRAEIETINSFSAHADYNDILQWLGHFESGIKKIFITHGEIEAAQALKKKIEERFGWSVVIPKYLESFDLD